MKDWLPDNPKAKLMARKRAAIVEAARKAFLRDGFAGASMEGIAQDAGVSIMTLYRHAEGKDDLFAAVIESACHPEDQDERARLDGVLQKSLAEILAFVGVMFQNRLSGAETTSLLRVVMTEMRRFPQLGEMAYRGLIGTHEQALLDFLSDRPETRDLSAVQRHRISAAFFDRLVGLDSYRGLLGLPAATEEEMQDRATQAASEMIAAISTSTSSR
ncbi:TetR/AcrR family transcriptional regulator [Sphingomonas sp. NFR15]|uniref:TetR/AcrR family transcriptional regulator n=1 Tax=Sphingomonas sp. NFR15 TaxID=1566282 RepID=UPI0008848C39|nr:TetR/AcrR family transcriptional regulator [Sphingomonas sp. NFR15]SDA35839.1 transcriptional regulator, TetR family [Sphingomonas sp. NFR15]